MARSIDDFLEEINTTGVAKSCNFTCQITPPSGVDQSSVPRSLVYRLSNFELTGRKAKTFSYSLYGPKRNIITGQEYPNFNATFICSPNHKEKEFFETWQDRAMGTTRKEDSVNENSWNVNYYNSYIGEVVVTQFDDNNNPRKRYTFKEAFPLSIDVLTMDWSSDSILTIGIEFCCRRYKTE
jgi:hypothetical protein